MNAGERINKFKEYAGDISWAALARKVGLRTQQRFYDIRNGKHSVSSELAKKITDVFPEISTSWLMYGEGEMLVPVVETPSAIVPTVDMTKSAGALSLGSKLSVGSLFPDAEYAMEGCDAAMSEYPEGSVVIVKEVADIDMLMPSRDYVFLTEEYCVLRRYQQELPDGRLMLYPTNQATYADGMRVYAPINIARDRIKSAYIVIGVIRKIG